MMKLQYFCIFVFIWWLLKFLVVFFCGKLTKPCCHARTFKLVSQQSLTSIIFNKSAACIHHHCPLWHKHVTGALVYRGIPSDLRTRPEIHHLPGALLPSWWLQAVYSLPKGDPTFNYTEKALELTIYDYDLKLWQNEHHIWLNLSFDCRIYLSSDICRMHWVD